MDDANPIATPLPGQTEPDFLNLDQLQVPTTSLFDTFNIMLLLIFLVIISIFIFITWKIKSKTRRKKAALQQRIAPLVVLQTKLSELSLLDEDEKFSSLEAILRDFLSFKFNLNFHTVTAADLLNSKFSQFDIFMTPTQKLSSFFQFFEKMKYEKNTSDFQKADLFLSCKHWLQEQIPEYVKALTEELAKK